MVTFSDTMYCVVVVIHDLTVVPFAKVDPKVSSYFMHILSQLPWRNFQFLLSLKVSLTICILKPGYERAPTPTVVHKHFKNLDELETGNSSVVTVATNEYLALTEIEVPCGIGCFLLSSIIVAALGVIIVGITFYRMRSVACILY